MPSTEDKQGCVIAVCGLAPGLNRFLRWSDDFLARYTLNVKPDCLPASLLEQIAPLEDEIRASGVFIHHAAAAVPELGDHREAYAALLDRVARDTHLISVPRPEMPTLWPFHLRAPEQDSAPQPFVSGHDRQPCARFDDSYVERHADPLRPFQGRFNGAPGPAHQDAYIRELLRDGLEPAEIAARYAGLDIARAIDLDAHLAGTLSTLANGERTCDVKVADFIAATLTRERLFCLIDQPSNRLLFHMANQILTALGCAEAPALALDRTQELHGWSCPVHPGIGRHFGLSYADERTRYAIDRTRLLTFEEYITYHLQMIDERRQ